MSSNKHPTIATIQPPQTSLLFQPVDIAPLALFRVLFGVLGFADLLGVWTYYHLQKEYFNPDKFQFKYFGFEWVRPLQEPGLSVVFLSTMAAALLVTLGRWYRVAAVVFATGFTYVFLLEKALYLNHGYLFCWLSWLMVLLPAHRQWSLDVLKNPALRSDQVARWALWILPFLMGIVYFFGGVAKLNADWLLRAEPMKMWLSNRADMPLLGKLWALEGTAYLMAWGGMLLDLSAPFLLCFRQTRPWALGFLLLFHLTNTLLFQIGIFPWLSLGLSLLFFPPDTPRRLFALLKQRSPLLAKLEYGWERRAGISWPMATLPPNYPRLWVKMGLSILLAVHLALPLRHWCFRGDVAWTEEGHRFAWRMMLRSKQGHGYFEVNEPGSPTPVRIKPTDYLTDRQAEKLFAHPDMVLQFAHYLRDLWALQGKPGVEVHASVRASLNNRKSRPLINSEVDLAKIRWDPWRESGWVLREPGK